MQDFGARRRVWLDKAQRYAVLNAREPESKLRALLQGGCDVVQLREDALTPAQIVQAARGFRRLCDAYDALFIVNDRPDLALVCGADGVHIELAAANPPQVRRFVGQDLLIGLSAYDQQQLDTAEAESAIDYVIDDPGALLAPGSEFTRSADGAKPRFRQLQR
ncbi:MAG: thiamine phosphate synthase [Solirubrobacterales bacterium]